LAVRSTVKSATKSAADCAKTITKILEKHRARFVPDSRPVGPRAPLPIKAPLAMISPIDGLSSGCRREAQGFAVYFQRVSTVSRVILLLRRGPVTRSRAARRIAAEEPPMPAIDPDDLPKKKVIHEMGQDLALLSVGELTERITLLKDEISRLEAEMARKKATKSAADMFFKK
jgi:uncharacterized small protein (DUF1192 family)